MSDLPVNYCPGCREKLDAATAVREPQVSPKAEDLTICLYCGIILVYEADLSLRLPTAAEISEFVTCDDGAGLKALAVHEAYLKAQQP